MQSREGLSTIRCLCFISYLLSLLYQHLPFYWLVLININMLNFHLLHPKYAHFLALQPPVGYYLASVILFTPKHLEHSLQYPSLTSHAPHFSSCYNLASASLFSCSAKIYNKLHVTEIRDHCQAASADISEASDTCYHILHLKV